MPRTRTAERRREAAGTQGRESVIAVSGRSYPLSRAAVARAAEAVLSGEDRAATLSIAFVGRERIRDLNRRWKGHDAPTDVLGFALTGLDGSLTGDIYISPWMAAANARALAVPLRRELTRLVIHAVLHVLGFDHPETTGRTASPMWRRQERYLRGLR